MPEHEKSPIWNVTSYERTSHGSLLFTVVSPGGRVWDVVCRPDGVWTYTIQPGDTPLPFQETAIEAAIGRYLVASHMSGMIREGYKES